MEFFSYIKSIILKKTTILESNIWKDIKNHFNNFFKTLTPNLFKLIVDLLEVYKSHKNFILYNLRVYLYISIILYFLSLILLTSALITESKVLIVLANFLTMIYKLWTTPIKKIRFLIKYVFLGPIKIIQFSFIIVKNIILRIINFLNKPNKNECSGNRDYRFEEEIKETKSPKKRSPDRTVSSTEWELNCMRNKFHTLFALKDSGKDFMNAAKSASNELDQSDQTNIKNAFNQASEKYYEKKEEIDRIHYCPTAYGLGEHNKRYDNIHHINNINKKP